MHILGINSVFHESAACLLEDGRIVAAAEEERFTRRKHAKTPRADNPDELPWHAMRYCLAAAGIDLDDVDHVGYSSDPRRRRAHSYGPSDWTAQFDACTRGVPGKLRLMGFSGRFHWVDHHTAHAASAFYASPFDESAVLTIDGIGDDSTTASFLGTHSRLRPVQEILSPHSLGFLWELVSMFLGFDIYDATKIMGLAAYGDPKRFAEHFRRLVRLTADGRFVVDSSSTRFWLLDYQTPSGYFDGLARLFGVKRRAAGEELADVHRDIAAALQQRTDETVLHMVQHLHGQTGARNLCLAGGCALNCVTNQYVFDSGPFDGLFVTPAAHDAGTAIGAAFHIWHHVLGRQRVDDEPTPYLGPEFSPSQIEQELRRYGLRYTKADDAERHVAELLSRGLLVGYLQGRMEIGPRALGNRSLLADPRHPNMREILNQRIKHREAFRPFAPSVLAEEARRWFQLGKDTSAYEYMLMACPIVEAMRDRIPAVAHVDGTSRIQAVRREANPRYHRLISEFQRITGVPVVLNTSFNDQEPIVCSPEDAIRTFLRTEIDYLALGDFLVSKRDNRGVPLADRRRLAWPVEKLVPGLQDAIAGVVSEHRVCRIGGIWVVSDRTDRAEADQVLPLFAEQEFFLDEMARDKIAGAEALEIGIGSGVLSIAAARAGARRVTALEINPRARLFAGWNILLNGCEDRVEIVDGSDDVFAPVRGRRFDYVLSNPPFMPTPPGSCGQLHSAAGIHGLDVLARIVERLDDHLVDDGHAQIVMVAPGDRQGPSLLISLLQERLRGACLVRVNAEPTSYDGFVQWLQQSGSASDGQAREMIAAARRDGVSHLHLCMIHYDRRGPASLSATPAAKVYRHWCVPLPGIEPVGCAPTHRETQGAS